jgi:hypothetical protein
MDHPLAHLGAAASAVTGTSLGGVSPFLDEVFETAELPGALCIRNREDEAPQAVACAS